MEIVGSGNYQMNQAYELTSLRQSENWCKYLESLGWKTIETDFGAKINLLKTYLGYVTKIQKTKPLDKNELDVIEKICRENKAMFIKIEPGIGQDEDLLVNLGYKRSVFPLSPPKTLVIDLQKNEQELWNDVSRSGKYSVNRAKREKSTVSFYQHPQDEKKIAEFYAVVKATGKRGKFYVQPLSDLTTKIDLFADQSFLVEVCNEEQELESAKMFFGAGNTVTFIQGGTTEIGRKSKGGYLMMWESILYFKKMGYTFIDLEGVDDTRFPKFTKDWGGFSHFKEKFGGFTITYPPPYVKYLSPILKILYKLQPLPF